MDQRNQYDDDQNMPNFGTMDSNLDRLGSLDSRRPKPQPTISTLTVSQNQKLSRQFSRMSRRKKMHGEDISEVDCTKMLRHIGRELKGIKYKLSTVISNGDFHIKIDSMVEKRIEVIPSTPIY